LENGIPDSRELDTEAHIIDKQRGLIVTRSLWCILVVRDDIAQ
jgi:hypothetical protein